MLNNDYKFVATLLVRSLRAYLPDLVSPYMSCAVPGRSIVAALTLTSEVFEYACAKRFSGVLVSMDQAKAFDAISHSLRYNMAKVRRQELGWAEVG